MGRKAEPVRVITSADLIDNGGQYKLISKDAIKISGDDTLEIMGGSPVVVYPVSPSEISNYNLIQGEPVHVAEAPVSRGQDSSRWAYPVYHVGPGTWPPSGGGGSAPSAPSSLTVTENGADTMDLAWTDNSSDETDFEIERRTLPGGSFALIHTTAASVVVYADSGLSPGAYEYRVRAVNSFGNSAYSNTDDGFLGAYNGIANLVHVYEPARRTLTSYTGPLVRIRRSSDNVEQDFGYTANGDLDTAAIATFVGGGSGNVVTVYDQAGSNNPTQATAGSQPAYVASGQNSKPVTRFANDSLKVSFTSLPQPTTIYGGAKATSVGAGSQFILDGADGSNRNALYTGDTGVTWNIFAGAGLLGDAADTNAHLIVGLFNGASSQSWKDGESMKTGSAGAQASAGVAIGSNSAGSSGWPGDIFMIAIANPSHDDTERVAMETAINDYWATFRFRISLISRGNDLGTAETQGVAYDGTYYYFMASDTVYRYTRSGSTYTLDTFQSFAANMPAGATQINSMNIHDGYIWAGVNNFSDEPGESWIMQIDLSTLTFVANHALDDAHWTEGGAWYDVGAGDDFWAVFHDWDRVARYRFVGAVWTKIDDYLLPLVEGQTTNLYQGAVWYNDGSDDYLITQTHSIAVTPRTHFHRWTGTGFEATESRKALDGNVGQGIHWETEGSVLLFAERDAGGNGQTIIRATLTDGG